VGKTEGKNNLEDLGLRGRIMLKFILKESDGRTWTGIICLRIGKNGGLLWKTSETIRWGEFID
jgi:hypothetical protein